MVHLDATAGAIPCICDTQHTIVAKWQAKEQAAQHAAAALRWRGTGAQAAGGADRQQHTVLEWLELSRLVAVRGYAC